MMSKLRDLEAGTFIAREGRSLRGLWVVEIRTRQRYPKFRSRLVARWGKWSAWRPHLWMNRDLKPLTRAEAKEFASAFLMLDQQFRAVRYTP
jgi:hypothetical protein